MDSVYLHKKAFIQSQIRLLSKPLDPPLNWRENAKLDEEGNELLETFVAHAIYRLNVLLRKQHRIIFSSQAIRHVSEQIDRLYHLPPRFSLTEPVPIDFHSLNYIEQLPVIWESDDEQSVEKYTQLRARLISLASALEHLRQKYEFYQLIETSLVQLKQPIDLPSRLSTEFERTKTLISSIKKKLKKNQFQIDFRKINYEVQEKKNESLIEFCEKIKPYITNQE